MEKTCVVIPCYNEGLRLPVETFERFLAKNPCSLYFVNDGSTDNTIDVLKRMKLKNPNHVQVIELSENVGKGEAIRRGFLTAFETGKFEYIGYLDADLATPLEEIEYLLKHFEKNTEIVLGARVLRLGAVIKRDPLRHYLGRVFATLANNVLDIKVYDSQCGAKIFKTNMAQMLFTAPFISKWLFDLELLYRLKMIKPEKFNEITLEIPLRTWKEKGGSKIRLSDFLNVPWLLIKIRRETPAIIGL